MNDGARSPARGRWRRTLVKLAVAVPVTLLLAVAAVEGVLRLTLDHRPSLTIYDLDFETGKSLRPSFRGVHYGIEVTINSAGMRGPEHANAAEPGTARILTLGDSWTFGVGIALEETWPRRLETLLSRPERPVEVLNAGVAGDGTFEEAIRYDRLEGFEHDLVLVGFYPVNDVHEDYVRYARHRWLYDLHPALLDLYKFPERHLLLSHWLKTMKKERKKRAKVAYAARLERDAVGAPDDASGDFAEHEDDWTALYDESDEGWRTVVRSLAEIGRMARERGARGAVVLLPDLRDLERYVDHHRPRILPELQSAVEAAGLELIDLAEDFRPLYGRETEHGLGRTRRPTHPNELGYEVIARAVAREIEARGLLPGS